MTNLNDYFERIVVLNLPYKPDRRARLERHLRQLGLTRVVTWMRAYSGDMMPHPAWWTGGNGAWGCLLSHARVVEEAIMDGIESYLVLEDDVVFQSRAGTMLAEFMPQLPEDWDQIYLGGQHLREPMDVADRPGVLRAWNVNRTHAFALRKKAFVKFHQHIWHAPDYIAKSGGWHIDHQLGLAHERNDWTVYAPLWWLAGQEGDWSNISGRYNPRLWWHPSRHAAGLPFIEIPAETSQLASEVRDCLHPGNTLKQGTLEDVGLDAVVSDDDKLREWLAMIAREAMDMHRLPAWQHADIPLPRIAAAWKRGAIPLGSANLHELIDYPWNGILTTNDEDTGLRQRPAEVRESSQGL